MKCFDNFITPKNTCTGFNPVKPVSGLWVDDLPGISTQALAKIEPGKYGTAANMISEKVRVACMKVMDFAKTSVGSHVREGQDLEAGTLGTYGEDYLGTSGNKRGQRIKMDAGGGLLMKMLIPRVRINSRVAVNGLEVIVSDGVEVMTHTIDLFAGETKTLDLHYLASGRVVEITIENATFDPLESSTESVSFFTSCSTCGGTAKYQYLTAHGLNGTIEGTECFGIETDVIATCSFEEATCLLLRRYRWAILYQFGVECLEEWKITGQMNFLGIHGKPWAEAMVPKWEQEVALRVAEESKGTANFLSRLHPDCTQCGTGVHYGYSSGG